MDKKSLEEAFEEIERLYQNPETHHIAMSREFFLKDQMHREQDAYDEGYQEGLELGRLERWKEIIINMVESDCSIEMIAKTFNTSIVIIEEFLRSEDIVI